MNVSDAKLGQEVLTYCAGQEVVGVIIEVNKHDFIVEHEEVFWGGFSYTKTRVKESTPLQKQFYSDTSPYCELVY